MCAKEEDISQGDLVLAGAYRQPAPGFATAGAAYVWQRVGGVWTYAAKLQPPSMTISAEFGRGVAIEGSTLAVGAPRFNTGGQVGAVFTYTYDSDTLTATETALVQAESDRVVGDHFGTNVAIRQSRMFVAASGDDDGASASGSIFVFDLADNNSQAIKFVNPVPAANKYFGGFLTAAGGFGLLHNDKVVVGATGDAYLLGYSMNPGGPNANQWPQGQHALVYTCTDNEGNTGSCTGTLQVDYPCQVCLRVLLIESQRFPTVNPHIIHRWTLSVLFCSSGRPCQAGEFWDLVLETCMPCGPGTFAGDGSLTAVCTGESLLTSTVVLPRLTSP